LIPRLAAPAHWEHIDLLSDLHLGPDTPATLARLARHLAETPAQALMLLGDIFEVWVGDDARHEPFEAAVVSLLAEASRQRALFFMPGNRDFLAGAELMAATGMTALPDPTVLDAFGRPWLLAHGDEQCLADDAYQAWRATSRSAAWRADFLAKPLAERQA
jgi:UDP-2,3-diacylglucosamine hydrolase